jgi:hypothetical protein
VKISALCVALQAVLAEHGDIDVIASVSQMDTEILPVVELEIRDGQVEIVAYDTTAPALITGIVT